ncbi:MAG: sulfite exporter TauE/SafE family protein [Solirubrobacterales bacterium]
MTWLLIVGAAFLAGALNAVAGGGTFLTLPALVFAGVPPIAANATSTVAVLPGYVASVAGFRSDLAPVAGIGLRPLAGVALAGGIAGALLLLVTPARVFQGVVPWLLVVATLLFAFGPRLSAWARGHALSRPAPALGLLFAISVYGGYFNGGLGILLLAGLALLGVADLNAMNGLKNVVSTVLSVVSAATFAVAGIVDWPKALVMMAAAAAGGWVGARLGRRIPPGALRAGIVAVGATMAVLFFLR